MVVVVIVDLTALKEADKFNYRLCLLWRIEIGGGRFGREVWFGYPISARGEMA